jgi:hypothetical protein
LHGFDFAPELSVNMGKEVGEGGKSIVLEEKR